MGSTPSNFTGDNLPVEPVDWPDAVSFCDKLGKKEGKQYRLPTEAEWEFACRAGTHSAYFFGDEARNLGKFAWYLFNSGAQTHLVGTKAPNAWGLYDMSGNVYEWCSDWYADYPNSEETAPKGPPNGQERVVRGGAWNSLESRCRCACRDSRSPTVGFNNVGFRVVLEP